MMADIPDLDPEQVESMVTMHRGMFWSILKGVAIVGAWMGMGGIWYFGGLLPVAVACWFIAGYTCSKVVMAYQMYRNLRKILVSVGATL